jgi:hypothetical protein
MATSDDVAVGKEVAGLGSGCRARSQQGKLHEVATIEGQLGDFL